MAKTTFEIDIETAGAVNSAKDLREQFNILEDKMFELAAAGKQGTKEFEAIRNQLAGTKEKIDDLNESIDMLKPEAKFQAFANLGAGIASGFAAAQGAAQLFGSESEALNESLAKVQSTMALAQGIQGLAGMGDSLKIVGTMLKSTTIGTQVATVAQRVYNAVMNANPIAKIIAGLTALVGIIALVVNAMGDETEAMEESIKQREKELELMNEAAVKLKAENKFRLDLAAAQGKSAKELAALNEQNAQSEIKSIDKRVQALKQEIVERSALMKFRDGEELKKLQEANSKSLEEMKKLANERLAIQQGLIVAEAKLETDAKKDAEEKAKEAKEKAKERAKEDLEDREYWRKRRLEEQAAEQFFSDELAEEEKNKKIFREKALQDELELNAKQNDEFNYKLYQEQKKRDEDLLLNKKKAKEQEIQLTLQGLTAIQELTDAFAGKSTESQKRAFQIKKAASLAQATIETYQAAQSAYASQMTIPTPDAPVRAAIAAGISIASGLARVAVIAKQKFEAPSTGGGGSGGGNLGTFSQGGGQPPQGLTAQNTVTQLNPDGTVASQGQRQAAPMKAYVVESESRAVTERVNKLSNNSKIG